MRAAQVQTLYSAELQVLLVAASWNDVAVNSVKVPAFESQMFWLSRESSVQPDREEEGD